MDKYIRDADRSLGLLSTSVSREASEPEALTVDNLKGPFTLLAVAYAAIAIVSFLFEGPPRLLFNKFKLSFKCK